jgi:hypothetical protein
LIFPFLAVRFPSAKRCSWIILFLRH